MSNFRKHYDTALMLEQKGFFRRATTVWRQALRAACGEDEENVAFSGIRRCSSNARYNGGTETL
ncbi:hypothetical protein NG99_17020 [Erwinia typographi]|uniref:PerC family transcriptional regulator n=1 Tax=Erwinia typographi TaxID=371042 RepID=A0A0A3YWN5_9GAMM|nr:hypothetical protein [Erwinia typographi]KGT91267.1 hypothetical protein NG99_17020 [Erwinia typographi]